MPGIAGEGNQGVSVRLWTAPCGNGEGPAATAGRVMARMLSPGGRSLCGDLDIGAPALFMSMVHNADCATWRGEAPCDHLPVEIARLVNHAVSSTDPVVAAACDELYRGGAEVDFPTWETTCWRPGPEAERFIRRCAAADDPEVSTSVGILGLIVRGRMTNVSFEEGDNLEDIADWMDRWLCEAAGADLDVVDMGTERWIRLRTIPALCLEARRIGRLEGEFLNGRMSDRLAPRTLARRIEDAHRMARAMSSREGHWSLKRGLGEDQQFWSLRDAAGTPLGIACMEFADPGHGSDERHGPPRGELFMCGPRGRDAEALTRHFDAVMALRTARMPECREPDGPGMRP